MNEELEKRLVLALEKMNQAKEVIENQHGFCQASQELRILEELIKEQVPHEYISCSTSTPG